MVMEYCRNGHEMTPENKLYRKEGSRVRPTPACRECKRIQRNRSRYRANPAPRPSYRWYGDKCVRGHVLTERSAGERITPSGVRLWCRDCNRETNAERAAERRGEKQTRRESLRRKRRDLGDACPAGKHVLTEETARIYPGKQSYTCLPCKRERDQVYKEANPEKVALSKRGSRGGPKQDKERVTPEEQRMSYNKRQRDRRILQIALQDERLLGDELSKADDERPGAVWNLLKPTGRSLQALNELQARQDEVVDEGGAWNCRDNPAPFMDSWMDEDEEGEFPTPPPPNRVRAMCEDCPLFVVCQNYGIVSRDPGIWGGLRVGLDGKIYN